MDKQFSKRTVTRCESNGKRRANEIYKFTTRRKKKMHFDLFLEENQKERKFMFMMFVCLHKKLSEKFNIITSYVSGKMT